MRTIHFRTYVLGVWIQRNWVEQQFQMRAWGAGIEWSKEAKYKCCDGHMNGTWFCMSGTLGNKYDFNCGTHCIIEEGKEARIQPSYI